MRQYDILVAKIYEYVLTDSFSGFLRLIDSPTSYATLVPRFIFILLHYFDLDIEETLTITQPPSPEGGRHESCFSAHPPPF